MDSSDSSLLTQEENLSTSAAQIPRISSGKTQKLNKLEKSGKVTVTTLNNSCVPSRISQTYCKIYSQASQANHPLNKLVESRD